MSYQSQYPEAICGMKRMCVCNEVQMCSNGTRIRPPAADKQNEFLVLRNPTLGCPGNGKKLMVCLSVPWRVDKHSLASRSCSRRG